MSDEETRIKEIVARFRDLPESKEPAAQAFKKTWMTSLKTALVRSQNGGGCWSRRC